jgi:insertion element IS1 protein InsB
LILCEVDEQWSFVGSKRCPYWLWYAWDPIGKRIVAHAFGRRNRQTLRTLLKQLAAFTVVLWYTDRLSAYRLLPSARHLVNKHFTQGIERMNLTLRTRLKRLNRKTIGYSKSVELHEKVIGTFIEHEYYG